MSNKQVCAYGVNFYYMYNDVVLSVQGDGNYKHLVSQHPFYGNWFLVYGGMRCGYMSLVNKYYDDGSGKYDRLIIHDLKVDFEPYYTDDKSDVIRWCIMRVKNNEIFHSPNTYGALNLKKHGVVREASKQLMISSNFDKNNFNFGGWSATSQNFTNLDYDLPVEDNLLLLLSVDLADAPTPLIERTYENNKRVLLTRKNFARFGVAYTYSYSRF